MSALVDTLAFFVVFSQIRVFESETRHVASVLLSLLPDVR